MRVWTASLIYFVAIISSVNDVSKFMKWASGSFGEYCSHSLIIALIFHGARVESMDQ